MYQNHGLLQYLDYDSIITGSSMTDNFFTDEFDKKFDIKTLKVSYDGGEMKDYTMLLDCVFSTHDINKIFGGVDLYYIEHVYATRYEYEKYQVSNNPFWKVRYLLNNNILLHYSMNTLL